jgi:urea carboxylase-associated protein 1
MEPKAFKSFDLHEGTHLRLEDVDGVQCADLVFFNLHDFDEKYAPGYTVNLNRNIFLARGGTLYSTLCNPMMTIVEDTVGHHDCISGTCSPELNRVRFGEAAIGKRTCRENLEDAAAEHGIAAVDVPFSFNIFMDYPVSPEGDLTYGETASGSGDYIELRAEMDLLVAISNCPQELNPANGYNPTRLRVTTSRPAT